MEVGIGKNVWEITQKDRVGELLLLVEASNRLLLISWSAQFNQRLLQKP